MFCKNCGARLDNDARFCGECGTEVRRVRRVKGRHLKKTQRLSSARVKPWYGFFLLGVIFIVASAVTFIKKYDLENKAYQILKEAISDYPDLIGTFTTPLSSALSAVIKSPFIYLAGICFVIGFVWWYKRR